MINHMEGTIEYEVQFKNNERWLTVVSPFSDLSAAKKKMEKFRKIRPEFIYRIVKIIVTKIEAVVEEEASQ